MLFLCNSPFVTAELVNYFFDHGAKIDPVNEYLAEVCENIYLTTDILNILSKHGLDVTEQGEAIMEDMLIRANPNPNVIKYFCEHGIVPKIVEWNVQGSILEDAGDILLEYISKEEKLKIFDYGCETGLFYLFEKLLKHGLDPNNDLLLIRVCSYRFSIHRYIIQYLISNGVDVNQTDGDKTPLSLLCHGINGHTFELIKLLVEHGAKVDEDCIFYAAFYGSKYVEYLAGKME